MSVHSELAGSFTRRRGARLRILCLHGYGHNGMAFVNKMADMATLLADHVEFVPLDGPHCFGGGGEARRWWTLQKPAVGQRGLSDEQSTTMRSELQASLDELGAAWQKQGPFDGILGYSQGGVLATIVLKLQEHRQQHSATPPLGSEPLALDAKINFSFALLFNCCESRSISDLNVVPSVKITTDTLLAVARNDPVIAHSSALEFRRNGFVAGESLVYFEHDNGHWLPQFDGVFRPFLVDFVIRMYKKINELPPTSR